MSKFKAGDLALNLQDIPSCISAGVVVELMSRLAPGDLFAEDGQTFQVIRPAWWVLHEGDRLYIPERYLMHLRGDFQPEQQKAKGVEA
ncbi:hypothetical protein [Pseudomonas aeruginosa]|uniref:hypothetical protein n=1 Tax=Pseudomonas aeruginosa TaxID=287 RepID=UPI00249F5792|nr:hypothetical protein [Pseudomonas aeruginosa]WGY37374.1 hypothetical protein LGV63_32540 [Pseudomonas aeruginosa]